MLVRHLPGRLRAEAPLPLVPARLGPLERSQLQGYFAEVPAAELEARFVTPAWRPAEGGWEVPLWPDVPVPPGGVLLQPPLILPTRTPMAEALRAALRTGASGPVPVLPCEGDPTGLQALLSLVPDVQACHGGPAVWRELLVRLSQLPAPPHFCARC